MKKETYMEEAVSLADYLISLTDNKVPLEYTDIENDKMFGNITVDDLGDNIPFIAWLGYLNNKKYLEWAEDQAQTIVKHYQMPNGLLCTRHLKKGYPKKNNNKVFNADKMSDSALGLNLMYSLTKDETYMTSLLIFFIGLIEVISSQGFIYYKKSPFFTFPFSTGKYCGLYIEELIKAYEPRGCEGLLTYAKILAYPWIREPFFKRNGLFPFKCTNPMIKPFAQILFKRTTSFTFDTAMLTKSNANLIFGLVRLQTVVKDPEIERALNLWVKAVQTKLLTHEGILTSIWQENKSRTISYLGADHAAIDALLEIYHVTNNKSAYDLAIRITNGWIKLQSETGLVIETPYNYDTKELSKLMKNYSMTRTDISRLDSQTDFAIMVLKVYELTEDVKYLSVAEKIAKGIIEYHKFGKGYVEFVNTETGEQIIKPIETKYLFLLLKLFLLMYEVKRGKKIYKDALIKDIIRDR